MKNENENSVATRVRRLRAERGLSQRMLAERAGMTPAQLCKIEGGWNRPTASTVGRLAQALGVAYGVLADGGEAEVEERPVVGVGELVLVRREGLAVEEVYRLREDAAGVVKRIHALERRLGVAMPTAVPMVFPYGFDERSAALVARDMRLALGLGRVPCEYFLASGKGGAAGLAMMSLMPLLERRGVRLVKVKRPKEFSSASFFERGAGALVIVLNEVNTAERNHYRIVYELGAAVYFSSRGFSPFVDEGAAHQWLRAFAANFLLPEEAVREAVAQYGIGPQAWTVELLAKVAHPFGMSAEAFALRLEALGLVDPALRARLRDKLRAYYKAHPRAMEPPSGDISRESILSELAKGRGR